MADSAFDKRPNYPDEITLVEFISSLREIIRFLANNWLIYLLSFLLCASGVLYWGLTRQTTYKAELTFMLNDSGQSAMTSFSGLFGQLGIPLNTGKYNIDKLLEISKSRSIIQKVLFEEVQLEDNSDYIANHLISLYGLSKPDHEKNIDLFQFSHDTLEDFDNEENYYLKSLYGLIIGSNDGRNNGLLVSDYGRDHYIMTFAMTSLSEKLSITFVNGLYRSVKEYFVQKTTERSRFTYDLIKTKRDSLRLDLSDVEYRIASLKDANLGTFDNRSSLDLSRLSTESLILKTALAKTEENLALAEFALENNTPLVQLIDQPIAPLKPISPSPFKLLVLSIIGAFLIGSLFILIKLLLPK